MNPDLISNYGAYSDIGPRRSVQQDDFVCLPEGGVFGVFDGHGKLGAVASLCAADYIRQLYSQDSASVPNGLTDHFARIDEQIPDHGGTTATVVRVSPYHRGGKLIVCNNVGDSEAVLIDPNALATDNGAIIRLATPHTPDVDEAERNRMERAGYTVGQPGILFSPNQYHHSGINSWIGMSRALGDREYPGVLSTPAVNKIVSKRERLLLLTSDGVVNKETGHQVVVDTQEMFRAKTPLGEIALKLVMKYSAKTRDNATAILLHLPASSVGRLR